MKQKPAGTKQGRGLSPEAQEWKQRLLDGFDISDDAGLLLLEVAMESFDEMRRAQAILERDGLTVKDRYGNSKPNPMLATVRDSRMAMMRAIRSLNLDIVPPGKIGRPGGR